VVPDLAALFLHGAAEFLISSFVDFCPLFAQSPQSLQHILAGLEFPLMMPKAPGDPIAFDAQLDQQRDPLRIVA
jgi:hypothetical protein